MDFTVVCIQNRNWEHFRLILAMEGLAEVKKRLPMALHGWKMSSSTSGTVFANLWVKEVHCAWILHHKLRLRIFSANPLSGEIGLAEMAWRSPASLGAWLEADQLILECVFCKPLNHPGFIAHEFCCLISSDLFFQSWSISLISRSTSANKYYTGSKSCD